MVKKIILMAIVSFFLFGCNKNPNKEARIQKLETELQQTMDRISKMDSEKNLSTAPIKKGMVKMAIFYPNGVGKTFDMDYYANKHMPLAASLLGNSLKAMSIDKGLVNGAADKPLQYVAIGYFYFENMAAFQSSMGSASDKLKADVSNYTNIQPMIQISEVQMME